MVSISNRGRRSAPEGLYRASGWRGLAAAAVTLLAVPVMAGASSMTPYDVKVESISDFQPLPIPGGGEVVEPLMETDWDAFPVAYDTGAAVIALPFPVRFYGSWYGEVAASARGFLTFGPRAQTICGGDQYGTQGTPATYPSCAVMKASFAGPIPRSLYPNRLVSVWWSASLFCNAGSVKYQTLGESPNRAFVIEWKNCGGGADVASQVWFREGTPAIEVRYGDRGMSGTGLSFAGVMSPPPGGGPAQGSAGLPCAALYCTVSDYPAGKSITYAPGPDLEVAAVGIDSAAVAGHPIRLSATLRNIGGSLAEGATIRFLLSQNPNLDGSASELTMVGRTFDLEMDESFLVEEEIVVPEGTAPGRYYLIAQADPSNVVRGDRNPSNNVGISTPIVIAPLSPVLTVETVEPPAAIVPGSKFNLSWSVRNAGSAAASAIPYVVVLSFDETIGLGDRVIGQGVLSVGAFDQLDRVTEFELPVDVLDGVYYVGLLVDPDRILPDAARPTPSMQSQPIYVGEAQLRIVTNSLLQATLGTPYCLRLDAVGGGANPAWTLADGSSLPPGLSLDLFPPNAKDEGKPFVTMLCGRPAEAGRFSFELQVSAGAEMRRRTYELEVGEALTPLQIATGDLPVAAFMTSFEASLRGVGGRAPYQWKLVGGRLPAGLALRADGSFIGAAMEDGRFPFSVRLTDSEGRGVEKGVVLQVTAPGRLTCGTRMLPAREVGEAYELSLSAAGGTKPYRWRSLATKRLASELGEEAVALGSEPPPGITMNGVGEVGGAPEQSGRYLWTVEVSDSAATKAEDLCTIVVDVAVERGLTVSTLGLLPGVAGHAYRASLSASGGVGELRWSLPAGNRLPAGLMLLADGTIEGSPELAQLEGRPSRVFSFVVEVRDSHNRRGIAPLSIQIHASREGTAARAPKKSEGGCSAGAGAAVELALIAALAAGATRRRRP